MSLFSFNPNLQQDLHVTANSLLLLSQIIYVELERLLSLLSTVNLLIENIFSSIQLYNKKYHQKFNHF